MPDCKCYYKNVIQSNEVSKLKREYALYTLRVSVTVGVMLSLTGSKYKLQACV